MAKEKVYTAKYGKVFEHIKDKKIVGNTIPAAANLSEYRQIKDPEKKKTPEKKEPRKQREAFSSGTDFSIPGADK